jgi:hypothetical protein
MRKPSTTKRGPSRCVPLWNGLAQPRGNGGIDRRWRSRVRRARSCVRPAPCALACRWSGSRNISPFHIAGTEIPTFADSRVPASNSRAAWVFKDGTRLAYSARSLEDDRGSAMPSCGRSPRPHGCHMPLMVIGAGMGRTGTKTLKFALERLGFGPSYHLNDLIGAPAHWPFWEQVVDGHRSDLETFFDAYESAVDAPAWRYFHRLSARYPAAKVVLTVRDASQWFASACATSDRQASVN